MVMIIADKYGIPCLLALARHNIKSELRRQDGGCTDLDIISIIKLVYSECAPEAMRELRGPIKEYLKHRHIFVDPDIGVFAAMLSAGSLLKDIIFELRTGSTASQTDSEDED